MVWWLKNLPWRITALHDGDTVMVRSNAKLDTDSHEFLFLGCTGIITARSSCLKLISSAHPNILQKAKQSCYNRVRGMHRGCRHTEETF